MNSNRIIVLLVILIVNFGFSGEVSYYEKIQQRNNFILILDGSGSMSGKPMECAKTALLEFHKDVHAKDRIAMITFNDKVKTLYGLTSRHRNKARLIHNINAAGSTALYDAIARGFNFLHSLPGARIIIYLTDGHDNRSHFSISDIASMTKSENIYVYGIGLGDVERGKLQQLSNVTGGSFQSTKNPADLNNIYNLVLHKYYEKYGSRHLTYGNLTIKSLPGNLPVYLSGRLIGKTPISISALEPGNYDVMVDYGPGEWECNAKIKAGYRAIIDARESEVGYSLAIGSRPVKSAVFLDNAYIGQTTITPIIKEDKFFGGREIKNIDKQLTIDQVTGGKHKLKIIAMPDSEVDLGSSLTYEFDFVIKKNSVINVDILRKEVDFIGQNRKKENLQKRINDSFEELDDL